MTANYKYPKNYYEARLVIIFLSKELDEIRKAPKSYQRSKDLLSIISTTHTIFDALDDAIQKCDIPKEVKQLTAARQHILKWMKHNKIPEKKPSGKK